MAVMIRNPPNTNSIHSKRSRGPTPAKMKMKRSTSAPTTPQNSTLNWHSRGTANQLMMIAQTNTLSTERPISDTYPETDSTPAWTPPHPPNQQAETHPKHKQN